MWIDLRVNVTEEYFVALPDMNKDQILLSLAVYAYSIHIESTAFFQ